MADMGAWQHTEIGPVGWQRDGWAGGGLQELGTDPDERLRRGASNDEVCLMNQPHKCHMTHL